MSPSSQSVLTATSCKQRTGHDCGGTSLAAAAALEAAALGPKSQA